MHVMPLELEMFSKFITSYKHSFDYLDENDDVTMYVTLNLNPEITDWENSELKPQWLIDKFTNITNGLGLYTEIITDTSLGGTLHQKQKAIKMDYDQFLFIDPDMLINEKHLKLMLIASDKLSGPFVIASNIPRIWDASWDILVHKDDLNQPLNQHKNQKIIDGVFTQNVTEVNLRRLNRFKFATGWNVLYSKQLWDLVGIPNEFRGYGVEDDYAMHASEISRRYGVDVKQYVLDGIYIVEATEKDYRIPSYVDKIKNIDKKDQNKEYGRYIMRRLLKKFEQSYLNK